MSKAWTAEDYLREFAEACSKAEAEGFEVVRGNKHMLLLDIDTDADLAHYETALKLLRGQLPGFGIREEDRWKSKSGKGTHIVIAVGQRELSTLERLFLQACLGSDRLHELLSYATGFLNGNEEPTVLFKPKQSRGAA